MKSGGGQIYTIPDIQTLNEQFNTQDAVIINGDVAVTNFNAYDNVVAIIGQVVQIGGTHA